MARRRTHATAARTRTVTIRLTEDEYLRRCIDARKAGLTPSGLCERLVCQGKVEITSTEEVLPVALLNELKRIGNNLNQLAHAANSGLPPDQRMFAGALRDLALTISENELLNRRSHVLRTRAYANDPPPPQTRAEFQRSVQVRPARRGTDER